MFTLKGLNVNRSQHFTLTIPKVLSQSVTLNVTRPHSTVHLTVPAHLQQVTN